MTRPRTDSAIRQFLERISGTLDESQVKRLETLLLQDDAYRRVDRVAPLVILSLIGLLIACGGLAIMLGTRQLSSTEIGLDITASMVVAYLPTPSGLLISVSPEKVGLIGQLASNKPAERQDYEANGANARLLRLGPLTDVARARLQLTWAARDSSLRLSMGGLKNGAPIHLSGYRPTGVQKGDAPSDIFPSNGTIVLVLRGMNVDEPILASSLSIDSLSFMEQGRFESPEGTLWTRNSEIVTGTIRLLNYRDRAIDVQRGAVLELRDADATASVSVVKRGVRVQMIGEVGDVRYGALKARRSLMPTLLDYFREEVHMVPIIVAASTLWIVGLGVLRFIRRWD